MSDDAVLLAEVLRLVEDKGITIHGISVGAVKIAFAAPWPGVKPTPAPAPHPQVAEVVRDRKPGDLTEDDLDRLRKASKVTFGRVLPDEQLREFAGIL